MLRTFGTFLVRTFLMTPIKAGSLFKSYGWGIRTKIQLFKSWMPGNVWAFRTRSKPTRRPGNGSKTGKSRSVKISRPTWPRASHSSGGRRKLASNRTKDRKNQAAKRKFDPMTPTRQKIPREKVCLQEVSPITKPRVYLWEVIFTKYKIVRWIFSKIAFRLFCY